MDTLEVQSNKNYKQSIKFSFFTCAFFQIVILSCILFTSRGLGVTGSRSRGVSVYDNCQRSPRKYVIYKNKSISLTENKLETLCFSIDIKGTLRQPFNKNGRKRFVWDFVLKTPRPNLWDWILWVYKPKNTPVHEWLWL